MRKYRDHIAELAPLESFDAAAFTGSDDYPQQLCDFVLALSLAFNDLKDLVVAHDVLLSVQPAESSTVTAEVGEYNGITLHLIRMHLAIVHELIELIGRNANTTNHSAFRKIVSKLAPGAREAWAEVTKAVDGKEPGQSDLGNFLFFARNKVVFHYDRKEISRGYAKAFVASSVREPFLSRGRSLATSRFYFADAAAEQYMREKGDPLGDTAFTIAALNLINSVTFAIHEVVLTFINLRGFGWRQPRAT